MANENCLDGMQCPQCGSEEPFRIEVITQVTMYDEGSDPWEGGDQYWDKHSYCRCIACDRDGTVNDFRKETPHA